MSHREKRQHDAANWLKEYADNGCDNAFAKLFRAYGGMVYASALRRTSDPQLAEDVTQETFAMLARKAESLIEHTSLAGWLFSTTRWIAHDKMKLERRKQEKIMKLQREANDKGMPATEVIDDALPLLDEALDALKTADREIILWHYFERLPYAEIATRVGKSEATCRKQASRAIERLGVLLRKQGYAIPAIGFGSLLTAHLCKAAPTTLASNVLPTSAAAAASLPISKLIVNSLQTMAYTKTKTALVVSALAVVPIGWQWNSNQSLRNQLRQKSELVQQNVDANRSVIPSVGARPVNPSLRDTTVEDVPVAEQIDEIINAPNARPFESLNRQINEMSPEEMTQLLVRLRSTRDHPQYKQLENILFFQLMQRGPEELINLKLAHPDLPVLGRTYRIWGQTDADAALAHLRDLENDSWYEMGLGAILQGLGDVEPSQALETLRGLEDGSNYHYKNLFRSWATVEPAEAAASLDRVPDEFRTVALTTVGDNWPELDPGAARAWVESLGADDRSIAGVAVEERIAQLENKIKKFDW